MDNRFIPCGHDDQVTAVTGKNYNGRNALPHTMNRETRRRAAKLAKKARKNGGRI